MASRAQENESTSEIVTASANTPFDSLTKLPGDLVPTGMQVSKFTGHYVHVSSVPKWFDWYGFAAAVTSYRGDDLVSVPIDTGRRALPGITLKTDVVPNSDVVEISSDTSPGDNQALQARRVIVFEIILDWMIHILHDVLGVAADVSELRANVYTTFTNLQWAHSSGFADFSSSSSGSNSSWEYRTVYAYRQPGETNTFLSMVTTIKLEADIRSESSWWGLTSSTTARFCATIRAGQLRATKGFTDPIQ
ncbi:delta-endotoxin CytB [Gloeophyllum trabeum ATCC 11539]|uniref:Delta-endotoxin CytB n=1 Tax=Gloeophyllum trabeum (strain ATCC 11539 / FP-39264 / Madison 617) TaxID=670483 RepID=S7Q789_GLOTA|nr:delta-endotoxin CytB [Gloeophyllum trabeum ATCC 11539]EPQ55392.1 delta-endotoxin CytB [Gloeophyllum trabeum ATCC 11539]